MGGKALIRNRHFQLANCKYLGILGLRKGGLTHLERSHNALYVQMTVE